MANGTLTNLIICIVFASLGFMCLIGAIFYGAWWHFFTGGGSLILAWVNFTDEAYGVESVKHYLQKKIKR